MPDKFLHKRIIDAWPYKSEANALSCVEINAIADLFEASQRKYLGLAFLLKATYDLRHPNGNISYEGYTAKLRHSQLAELPRDCHPQASSLRKAVLSRVGFSAQAFSEDCDSVTYLTLANDDNAPIDFTPIASDTQRTLYRKNFQAKKAHGRLKRSSDEVSDTTREQYFPLFLVMQNQFEFEVTKALLDQRIGSRRPWTQKQVMYGHTAKEILDAFGFEARQDGRGFHWAHQWGWGLGGSQRADNLDPTTAGSNYHTYALLESQIRHILSKEAAPTSLKITGRVQYWSGTPIPKHVYYSLSLGDSKQLDVKIDCNEKGYPHEKDQKAVRKFIKSMTPSNPAKQKSQPWQFATRAVFDTDGGLCRQKGFFAHQRNTSLNVEDAKTINPGFKSTT